MCLFKPKHKGFHGLFKIEIAPKVFCDICQRTKNHIAKTHHSLINRVNGQKIKLFTLFNKIKFGIKKRY